MVDELGDGAAEQGELLDDLFELVALAQAMREMVLDEPLLVVGERDGAELAAAQEPEKCGDEV